ncbi:MAG: ATPase, T2SS/T4P/T4SS family [Candidatus Micrarchaeota archaeon]
MESPLGWLVQKQAGAHDCRLSPLSIDEQQFLSLFADRFAEFSKNYDASQFDLAKKAISDLLPKVLESEGIEADEEQLNYLTQAAISHLAGFAPLDSMLSDTNLEEVAITGINQPIRAFVRKKGWVQTNAQITSLEYLIHLINKMARPLSRRITYQSPRINAILPDGSRLHATIPPLSAGEITIRLHFAKSWSIKDVLASKAINADALALLWLAFQSDSSVLICGNTASGKTTLLNSLFSFVPLNERIVQIEETPEIKLVHEHCVKLVSSDDLAITMPELVRDSLRMRPDRVIVGEVRTPQEAQAFSETLLSGQARGSYATFHAQSALEALRRLKNLGVAADDLHSLDFIAVQRRIARYNAAKKEQKEIRRMMGIYLVNEDGSPLRIFEYDSKSDSLLPNENLDLALASISKKLGLPHNKTKEIYGERSEFLQKLKQDDFEKCMREIQEFSYGGKK